MSERAQARWPTFQALGWIRRAGPDWKKSDPQLSELAGSSSGN
jgi:hypothetical protein